jgi:SAM-dependent MidA family methyltransferase
MRLEEMIQLGTLRLKADIDGSNVERLFGDALLADHKDKLRNVCALISNELFDALDDVVQKLSVSKRQFIEAAIVEAVEKAEASLATLQRHVEG